MGYGTKYLETEAILAAQARDRATLDEVLGQMLPGELFALSSAANFLAQEASETGNAKRRVERKRSRDA